MLQLPDVPKATDPVNRTRDLYLDLLTRSLANEIYWEAEVDIRPVVPKGFLKKAVHRALLARGLQIVRVRPIDRAAYTEGRVWPTFAHTMIGGARLKLASPIPIA